MRNLVDVKNKRRSERVVLRVPVTLSVNSSNGQPMQEKVFTNVVNAHGGLLVAQVHLAAQQLFDLTNSKTGATRQCSVVHTEKTEHGFSIAFQFEVPAPNFWPVAFPPADWQASTP